MTTFPDEVRTERLLLRRIRRSDAPFVYSYASDPEIVRYVAWPAPRSVDDSIAYLSSAEAAWEAREWFEYLILSHPEGTPVGALSAIPDGPSVMVGYVIAKPYWGRGFATEASAAIVNMALAQPEIYRVWTVCDAENQASARVLEKIGMQREGLLKKWKVRPNLDPKKPRDCYCYALTKDE